MKEFKEFAIKGNVVDLAVGVIIGGAFGLLRLFLGSGFWVLGSGFWVLGSAPDTVPRTL